MSKKALVVGGTGPTGPLLVQGLLDRGYEVTIFHRGVHETDELPPVEHIHGDPHFKETIEESLKGRDFDVVLAVYGRVRFIAEVMANRCKQFISVGGPPAVRGQMEPWKVFPFGLKAIVTETDPRVTSEAESRGGYMIALTEQVVMDLHQAGAFSATHLRYPQIYGPRQVTPREWSVVKRVLDGRKFIITPDNGLLIRSRSAIKNAAHCVLLAIDKPDAAAGQIYNCADDEQYTLRQWQELTAESAGGTLETISMAEYLASPFHCINRPHHHMLLDTSKIKEQLGYKDQISPRVALQEAVEWLIKNPVTKELHPNYPDHFDYAREDLVVESYLKFQTELREMSPPDVKRVHSYSHPKTPGQRDHHGR